MTDFPLTSKDRIMSMRRALELDGKRSTFSSGSEALDALLGGGFKTGEIVEVYGASNAGKTQLAMQTAVTVGSSGFSCTFVDTEGQFRPERVASIAAGRGMDSQKVLAAVYSIRAETTTRQLDAIARMRSKEGPANCKLVVVDTLTKNFTLEYPGSRMVGRRQTFLGAYLNRLARDAYQRDRAVIALNRVSAVTVEGSDAEIDIGGETVRHFAQKVLYLRRSGDFVMASRPDLHGPEVRIRMTEKGLV